MFSEPEHYFRASISFCVAALIDFGHEVFSFLPIKWANNMIFDEHLDLQQKLAKIL